MRFTASPNFGERKDGKMPRFIILHFTAMESAEEAIERLCDPAYEVSAHYVVAKNGDVTQLVEEEKRAWHAGASYWAGECDLNSASIGIELDNNGARPFENAQYEALIALISGIQSRWDIPPQNVLGHLDIAPGRKFDPGPWFDWGRLDRAGVSKAPSVKGSFSDIEKAAISAGYDPKASIEDIALALRCRHGVVPCNDHRDVRDDLNLLLDKA